MCNVTETKLKTDKRGVEAQGIISGRKVVTFFLWILQCIQREIFRVVNSEKGNILLIFGQ